MITIDFTYETITPESAEHGDFEESGFITPGHWKFSVDDYDRQAWRPGDLAGLVRFAKYELGIVLEGDDLRSVDPDHNYATGAHTMYAMHLDGMTAASEARIKRLFDSI